MYKALILLALFSLASFGQNNPASDPKMEINRLLERQVDAWNRHDLEGFMSGYWKSPELTFFSGGNVTRGWEQTLERYRRRYQSEGREMGKLDFFDIRVEPLGAEAAFVRGHWHLVMSNKTENGGLFTLVLRRQSDGWKIIHDHTSQD